MIDEKKLIKDYMNNYLVKNDGTWNDAIDRVVQLAKTAPKVGEWIPVSERLPNNSEHDWVLAQVQEDNGYMWIPRVMEYCESKDDWYDDAENGGWLKESHGDAFKVIAWMPLPEPYKEKEL